MTATIWLGISDGCESVSLPCWGFEEPGQGRIVISREDLDCHDQFQIVDEGGRLHLDTRQKAWPRGVTRRHTFAEGLTLRPPGLDGLLGSRAAVVRDLAVAFEAIRLDRERQPEVVEAIEKADEVD